MVGCGRRVPPGHSHRDRQGDLSVSEASPKNNVALVRIVAFDIYKRVRSLLVRHPPTSLAGTSSQPLERQRRTLPPDRKPLAVRSPNSSRSRGLGDDTAIFGSPFPGSPRLPPRHRYRRTGDTVPVWKVPIHKIGGPPGNTTLTITEGGDIPHYRYQLESKVSTRDVGIEIRGTFYAVEPFRTELEYVRHVRE